uniref:Uncharacterized protein n=1 Tax=Rhizophora mucronata TaxID=61149 RepID=A0A2P2PAL1_RHIMU
MFAWGSPKQNGETKYTTVMERCRIGSR